MKNNERDVFIQYMSPDGTYMDVFNPLDCSKRYGYVISETIINVKSFKGRNSNIYQFLGSINTFRFTEWDGTNFQHTDL